MKYRGSIGDAVTTTRTKHRPVLHVERGECTGDAIRSRPLRLTGMRARQQAISFLLDDGVTLATQLFQLVAGPAP